MGELSEELVDREVDSELELSALIKRDIPAQSAPRQLARPRSTQPRDVLATFHTGRARKHSNRDTDALRRNPTRLRPTATTSDDEQRRKETQRRRNERDFEMMFLTEIKCKVYSIFHPSSARIRLRPFSPIRDWKSKIPNSCISSTTRLAATEKIHRAAATFIIVPIDSESKPGSPRARPCFRS